MPRKKTVTTSPLPIAKIENQPNLSFEKAISRVKGGEKITKREWNNPEYYGVLADGFLKLHKPDGKLYQWLVSDGDIMRDDWIIL